jgi:hypothetical protein
MEFVHGVLVEVYSPGSGMERAIACIRTLDGMSSEMREFHSGNGDPTESAWWWIRDRCETDNYKVFALMPMRFDEEAHLIVDEDAFD